MNHLSYMAAIVLGASALGMSAAETEKPFSYAPAGSECYIWGTGKAESYDVAIRLTDPAMVGMKIVGMSAPIPTDQGITDVSGWMTKALTLEKKVNVPDIESVATEIIPEGPGDMNSVSVRFAEPYTITAEGVYVGYSFKVGKATTDNQKYPVTLTDGSNPDGFYIHSSRTYMKWQAKSEDFGGVSCITVYVQGDFPENAVAVNGIAHVNVQSGGTGKAKVSLVNHGSSEVSEIGYTYTLGGATESGTVELAEPLAAQFGSTARVEVPVKAPEAFGDYELQLEVTTVNGQPNEDSAVKAQGSVTVMAFVPVTRPLMEEYTGTWCGYCPRGYIALEMMKEKHPDLFVALSYHDNDQMVCVTELPNEVSGYPDAFMNRAYEVDPWYGPTSKEFGIDEFWEELQGEFAPANIDIKVEWADDAHNELRATSETRFVASHADADYRVSYCLVGDDIHEVVDDPADIFVQSNYYVGEASYSGPLWDIFTKGSSYVVGLTFNDIVLKYDDQWGIPGSLPSTIEAGQPIEHSYSFDIPSVLNVEGKNIISDRSKLRVVAVLTDAKTGTFVNCVSSAYPEGEAGVKDVESSFADSDIIRVVYHDLHGREVADPQPGRLYVRTKLLRDGRRITDKIF